MDSLEASTGSPIMSFDLMQRAQNAIFSISTTDDCSEHMQHITLCSDGLYTISHDWTVDQKRGSFWIKAPLVETKEGVEETKSSFSALEVKWNTGKPVGEYKGEQTHFGHLIRFPTPNVLKCFNPLPAPLIDKESKDYKSLHCFVPLFYPIRRITFSKIQRTNVATGELKEGDCGVPLLNEKGQLVGFHIGGNALKSENYFVTRSSKNYQ
jgi:hypothetical protein